MGTKQLGTKAAAPLARPLLLLLLLSPLTHATTATDVAESALASGLAALREGRAARAVAEYRQALASGPAGALSHENRSALFDALAEAYAALGKEAEAVGAMEEAHEALTAALGASDPRVGGALSRLADAHAAAGNHAAAAEALGRLVQGMRAQGLGVMHPGLRGAAGKHAAALAAAGRSKEAVRAYRTLLELVAPLPTEHAGGEVAAARVGLATALARSAAGGRRGGAGGAKIGAAAEKKLVEAPLRCGLGRLSS